VIDIDFLPQTYHQERARRAQIYKQWVMILLTAVTLAGWGISRQQQSAELASRTNSLETLANDTRQKQSEMDKLRKDHKSLAYQLKIQRQLDQPVATTQVVSVLGQLLPGSSGLTQIEIKTQRPPPIPLSDPNKKKKKPKRNASPQPPPKDFLEIDV
jgi:Tfp pilus assembly protein PilN